MRAKEYRTHTSRKGGNTYTKIIRPNTFNTANLTSKGAAFEAAAGIASEAGAFEAAAGLASEASKLVVASRATLQK